MTDAELRELEARERALSTDGPGLLTRAWWVLRGRSSRVGSLRAYSALHELRRELSQLRRDRGKLEADTRALAAELDVERARAREAERTASDLRDAALSLDRIFEPLDETILQKRDKLSVALRRRTTVFAASKPLVSIIIPVRDRLEAMLDTLLSIAACRDLPQLELIVADDGSAREPIAAVLSSIPFVTGLSNGWSEGFPGTRDRAARLARGEYILFLEVGLLVGERWLRALLECAQRDPQAAAIRSKVVLPDGAFDASGNLVSGSDPHYNVVRELESCDCTSLLVRRTTFEAAGGVTTDLCVALRTHADRIMYAPESVAVLADGAQRDRALAPVFARSADRKVALMLEGQVPEHDREPGIRIHTVIRQLRELRYDITLVPADAERREPYTTILQRVGVEVAYGYDGGPALEDTVRELLHGADVVWLGEASLATRFDVLLRGHPELPIIDGTLIRPAAVHRASFEETHGLLFIPSGDRDADAQSLAWLDGVVLPRIRATHPEMALAILAPDATDADHARVVLAPRISGAGRDAGLEAALALGLPIVTTSNAAAALDVESGAEALVADDPRAFGEAIARLYDGPLLWAQLAAAARRAPLSHALRQARGGA